MRKAVLLIPWVSLSMLTGCEGTTQSGADAAVAASDAGASQGGDAETSSGADSGASPDGGSGASPDASSGGTDAATTNPLNPSDGNIAVAFRDVSADCNAVTLPVTVAGKGSSNPNAKPARATMLIADSTVGRITATFYGDLASGKTFTCASGGADGTVSVSNMELIAGKYHYWGATGCAGATTTFVKIDAQMHLGSLVSFTVTGATMTKSSGYDAVGTYTIDMAGTKVNPMGL
ncbi:MAG: hypothetical protein HY901_09805 [Deltaproteobacteria bacterium]|nr:hypothetical protein [Deltaproteobacteria bacterium]